VGLNLERELALIEQIRAELVSLLPRLRRFGYALTGSPDDGDDLVQSACERALTRLDQFQPGTRLDSWMYRIMQNLWIDHRRSARTQRETGSEAVDLETMAVGDARRDVENSLALAATRRAVADLPEEQRAVLVLVCVEGLSYKDAAALLDIPIGTVMSRLARARLAVGKALDEKASPDARMRGGCE
jgi:RNA polymerase sigma-70 factor, ECF subfamily